MRKVSVYKRLNGYIDLEKRKLKSYEPNDGKNPISLLLRLGRTIGLNKHKELFVYEYDKELKHIEKKSLESYFRNKNHINIIMDFLISKVEKKTHTGYFGMEKMFDKNAGYNVIGVFFVIFSDDVKGNVNYEKHNILQIPLTHPLCFLL